MTGRPITLREVARRANVSVATVSYVLSGKGRMARETRQGIEQMLREAGIRPRYKRYPVFYISDHREFSDTHAFDPFLRLYDGLNASFHEAEVNLRVEFLHGPDGGPLRGQLERLLAYRPGAVVLGSNLREELAEVGRFFEERHVPAIQVGHTVRAADLDAAVVDNFGGAYAAVKHFLARGHRRVATIRWNVAGDPASSKKFAGYGCALSDAGIPLRPEYVVESPYTKENDRLPGRVAVGQLLDRPEPPTAVFVENSFISPSLIYASSPAEREVPRAIRDLDIIHFEAWHLEWVEQVLAGKLCYPERHVKLLRIDWRELGHMAAKRLLGRMEGAASTGQVMQLVPRLYEAHGDEYAPVQD